MPDESDLPAPQGQFLIHADGDTRLQVRLEGNTVWLTQKLIAELYAVSVPTVNEHLAGIYEDGELDASPTIRNFRIVQRKRTRDVSRNVEHESLDAIISVGWAPIFLDAGLPMQYCFGHRKPARRAARQHTSAGLFMRRSQGGCRA